MKPRAPVPLRLAVRFLPEEVREEVLGDLLEHWNGPVRDRHMLARVVWAWRQPLSVIAARFRFEDSPGGSRSAPDGDGAGRRPNGQANGRTTGPRVSWLGVQVEKPEFFKLRILAIHETKYALVG